MISTRCLRPAAVITAAGAVTAGLLALAGPAAAAVTPSCGMTITASLTLTSNLNCSGDTTGNAINIGAAGVTVDLNGHAILGPGTADNTETTGISDNGYSGLTVTGPGTISDFFDDTSVFGSSGSALTGVVITDLTTTSDTPPAFDNLGVYAVDGAYLDGARISGLTIDDAATGVFLGGSQDSVVTGNHLISPADGLVDAGGQGNAWTRNTMTGVTDIGVYAVGGAAGTLIQANAVTGSDTAYGVEVSQSTAKVMSNSVSNLYAALVDNDGTDATFNYNHGTGNAAGLLSQNDGSSGVTGGNYAHNTFSGGQYGAYITDPASVTLTLNSFSHNSEAGVYIHNDGDGPSAVSATLSRNTGDDNRFGLYSTFATGGSANTATGNAVINCHDVTCTAAGQADRLAGRVLAPPRLRLPPAAALSRARAAMADRPRPATR